MLQYILAPQTLKTKVITMMDENNLLTTYTVLVEVYIKATMNPAVHLFKIFKNIYLFKTFI